MTVAQHKHVARPRSAADYESAVPFGRGRSQHAAHVYPVLDGVSQLGVHHRRAQLPVETVILLVKGVAELFQEHHGVGIDTRMLSFGHYRLEDAVHIGHVEVAAHQQVARPPVVSPQKRMHIRYPRLPGSGISEMPHEYLAEERRIPLGIPGAHPLCPSALELREYLREYLGDGSRAERTFAKHIFVAGFGVQFHHTHSGGFLAAVVLFLHQQIQLLQRIAVRAILLFVILQRLAKAYHRHSALMFQRFQNVFNQQRRCPNGVWHRRSRL